VLDSLDRFETPHWKAEASAARLQAVGVAAAPVNRLDHVLADPWYRAEYQRAERSGGMPSTHGEPIRPFGRKQPVSRAPMLGEHTEDGSLLGLTPGERSRSCMRQACWGELVCAAQSQNAACASSAAALRGWSRCRFQTPVVLDPATVRSVRAERRRNAWVKLLGRDGKRRHLDRRPVLPGAARGTRRARTWTATMCAGFVSPDSRSNAA
jgi:hypothetical protein